MNLLQICLVQKKIIKKAINMLTLEQKLCIIVYVGLPSDASTISMAQDKKSDDFNMAPWSSGQDTTLSRW
jgi:hypothetical protein